MSSHTKVTTKTAPKATMLMDWETPSGMMRDKLTHKPPKKRKSRKTPDAASVFFMCPS